MPVNHRVIYQVVPAAVALEAFLLGVGRAAEQLTDCLSDGITVDAENPEQLVGLPAPGHLGNGQAVDGEAGLVHHRRANRLTETT